MKKINLFLFAFFFMVCAGKVNALSTCTMERNIELTGLASNINVDYVEYKVEHGNDYFADLEDGQTDFEPGFYIRIYNLTDDLKVEIKNSNSKEPTIAYKDDANDDGIIYYDSGYPGDIKNYNIIIRSNDINCEDQVIRQLAVTIPKLNSFYDMDVCRDNQDFALCQEYTSVDYSKVTDQQFMKQVEDFQQRKNEQKRKEASFWYRLLMFMKRYLWLFITLIVMGVGVYVYIKFRNKQRSKLV